MYWKEPETEQEALDIIRNANITNIKRIVKLKCYKDVNSTKFLDEILGVNEPSYEDKEFDLEDFCKSGKVSITHYIRVEVEREPKFWTLAITEVDGNMIHAVLVDGSDKEEVTSIEDTVKRINQDLEGTGVHATVVEFKAEMQKLRTAAIEEIKSVFKEMTKLYEEGSFPTIDCLANLIIKEDWKLGNLNCPSLSKDNKPYEELFTKLFKTFSENILITGIMLPIEVGMEDYNASRFIDALFNPDPTIGINMGTSISGIMNECHYQVCPSFVEFARRYLDE